MLIQLFSIELWGGCLPIRQERMGAGLTPVISKLQKGRILAAEGVYSGRRGAVTFGCLQGQFMLKPFQFRARDVDMETEIIFVPVFHGP